MIMDAEGFRFRPPILSMRRWDVAILYALTVAGYPLVSAVPTFVAVDSRLASLTFRALYLALSIGILVRNLRQRAVYDRAAWFPIALFWILYTARIVWDTQFHSSSLSLNPPDYFIWAFGTCFVPMLAFFGFADDTTLDLAASTTLITATIATALALFVSYKALTSGVSATYATGRLETETLNPISLGHLGASTAILSFVFFARWHGSKRLLLVLACAVGLFAVVASASRGPLLALVVVAVVWLSNWIRRGAWGRSLGYLAGTIALAALLGWTAFKVQERFGLRAVDRIVALHDIRGDASSETHLEALRSAWHEFTSNPVFGSALEEPLTSEYPHNVVVESFMATGFAGGLAFCTILVWATVAGFRLLQNAKTQWIALFFFQYAVAALVSGALYLSGTLWCFATAVIALEQLNRSPFDFREGSPAAQLSGGFELPAKDS